MNTDAEKLAAAIKAVNHVLHRICDDPATAFLLGRGTESYTLLCEAVAAYKGVPAVDIMETWEPARPKPLTSVPPMTERSEVLTILEEQLCEALSVSPCIAAELVAHAEANGLELDYYPETGDQKDNKEVRFWFCGIAQRVFVHWCDAQLLAA